MKSIIMLHHSLTKDSETVSWGAIRRFHTETQGWKDIGYHYGVELVGDQYEALVGRPENQVAAACKEGGMNTLAIHICCVGNYDLVAPPLAMLERLRDSLLRPIMERHHITPDHILGHRDFAPYKTCPGTMFDLDVVRKMVR